jgi:hypothetical protein
VTNSWRLAKWTTPPLHYGPIRSSRKHRIDFKELKMSETAI